MKLKRDILWFLTTLFAVCLAGIINRQGQNIVTEPIVSEHTASSLVTSQRQQPHEAVLTDAAGLYRICSSRPHRIVPTQGSRSNKRAQTLCFSFTGQSVAPPVLSLCDNRCRLTSAPFRLSASRDYYVIALRHIIR